jgi:membrane associated rhomboid family serine protease
MFFPLRDENPTQRSPFVNYGLIALNIAAFLYTWPSIAGGQWWILPGYGLVPTRLAADPGGEAFTILTSMFMHGGWGHLASNMLFLHIFGDNLEDMLGHAKYLAFYLLCGLLAALTQIGIDIQSPVPMVGASGAIAGVVGGYLLLFPRAPIVMLNLTPLIFFIGLLPVVPAWAVAGEFFLVNLWQAFGSVGDEVTGGVAVFAHLGGFVAGLLITRPLLGARDFAGRNAGARRWQGFRTAPAGAPGVARWRRRRRRSDDTD